MTSASQPPKKVVNKYRGKSPKMTTFLEMSECVQIPYTIHGTGIFTYMKSHKNQPFHVGKYTSPMDGMGMLFFITPCAAPSQPFQDHRGWLETSRSRSSFAALIRFCFTSRLMGSFLLFWYWMDDSLMLRGSKFHQLYGDDIRISSNL